MTVDEVAHENRAAISRGGTVRTEGFGAKGLGHERRIQCGCAAQPGFDGPMQTAAMDAGVDMTVSREKCVLPTPSGRLTRWLGDDGHRCAGGSRGVNLLRHVIRQANAAGDAGEPGFGIMPGVIPTPLPVRRMP